MKAVCGVYKITNAVTGGFYVGSSVRVTRRLSDHRCMLRAGRHDNVHLQRSFNKHGEGAFSFTIVAVVEQDERLATEQRFLDQIIGTVHCFNIAPSVVCGTLGRKLGPLSDERREQMRISSTGKPVSAESRAKISAANKGRPNYFKGKTRPESTRAKMSAWQVGRVLTDEHREKVRVANVGKKQSAETCAKRNKTLTGRKRAPFSDEWRANLAASKRRYHAAQRAIMQAVKNGERR